MILPMLKITVISVWLFMLARKDWQTRTLPNYLTLSGAIVFLVWRLGWGGVPCLWSGFLGGVIASLLLLLPFLLRASGAGDIKYLFAIGSLVGFPKVFATLFLICVVGVILGFSMLLTKRLNGARLKHLFNCIFNFRYDRQKGKASLPDKEAEAVRIPFGVAISVGTFISLVLEFLFLCRGGYEISY